MNPTTKKLTLAALIAGASLSLGFQQEGYPPIVKNKELYAENDLRGKQAPPLFVEKWLNTSKVDTKGKVVLVDFWATWCGPCRATIPELNELQKTFKGKLVVIGISNEPAETVLKFMEKTKMDYAVAVDTTRKMSSVLGVKGIPHVMIVSPDGVVRWQGFPGSGEDKLTEKVVGQIIAASKVQ